MRKSLEVRRERSRGLAGLAVSILAVGVLALAPPADARSKHKVGVCKATAYAARRACSHDVRDDYWIAIGKCKNLSARADRKDCEDEARAEYKDGRDECRDQRDARNDFCDGLGEGRYDPVVDPADFLTADEIAANPNPLLPLVPGTTRIYEGPSETVTVTVSDETVEILGVECIVVTDVVEEDGEVTEDTQDWFAQDVDGNVWYFGELSKEFEDGELVSLEGSWKAGVEGAKPGIVMEAMPQVGDVYRQEFALGDAEDGAEVVATDGSETVPAATCDGDCLVTLEFTPLEPDAMENKYYKPGVGEILEVDLETGDRTELIQILP